MVKIPSAFTVSNSLMESSFILDLINEEPLVAQMVRSLLSAGDPGSIPQVWKTQEDPVL